MGHMLRYDRKNERINILVLHFLLHESPPQAKGYVPSPRYLRASPHITSGSGGYGITTLFAKSMEQYGRNAGPNVVNSLGHTAVCSWMRAEFGTWLLDESCNLPYSVMPNTHKARKNWLRI
jgi:hypothetical protein